MRGSVVEGFFWTHSALQLMNSQQCGHLHKITPANIPASNGGTQRPHPQLRSWLLMASGTDSQFSLGVWLLGGHPGSTGCPDTPMHMRKAVIRFCVLWGGRTGKWVGNRLEGVSGERGGGRRGYDKDTL